MKTISIRELHEETGDWVRRCASLGPITVTDHGKVIAQIVPVAATSATNPFAARLLGKLKGGTDSTQSVSEGRDRT